MILPEFNLPELLSLDGTHYRMANDDQDAGGAGNGGGCTNGCMSGCNSGCSSGSGDGKN